MENGQGQQNKKKKNKEKEGNLLRYIRWSRIFSKIFNVLSSIYHIQIFLFSIFLLEEPLVISIAAWYHYFFLIFPLRTYFAGQEIVCLRSILFSVLIVEASFSSFAISRRYPSSSRVSFYRIMKRFFLFLCIKEFSSALNHSLPFYELYRQSNNWVISLLLPLYRILALSVTVVIHRFTD